MKVKIVLPLSVCGRLLFVVWMYYYIQYSEEEMDVVL